MSYAFGSINAIALSLIGCSSISPAADSIILEGGVQIRIMGDIVLGVDTSLKMGAPPQQIRIRGVDEVAEITISRSERSDVVVARELGKACAEITRVERFGLQVFPTNDRLLRDYLGSKVDKLESFWIAFEPSVCASGIEREKVLGVPYFLCGGSEQAYNCLRDVGAANFAFQYVVAGDEFARWSEIDELVHAYVTKHVSASILGDR